MTIFKNQVGVNISANNEKNEGLDKDKSLNDNEKKKFVADFMDQWEPIEIETMKRKQNARGA